MMDEDGAVDRMCCLQVTEKMKCRREKGFSSPGTPRIQNTVNSGFKRSNFLTLAAIKKWNYSISSIYRYF